MAKFTIEPNIEWFTMTRISNIQNLVESSKLAVQMRAGTEIDIKQPIK